MPLSLHAIRSVEIGSISTRKIDAPRQLDSYQDEDLQYLKYEWLDLIEKQSCIENIRTIETLNRSFMDTLKSGTLPVKNCRQLGTIIAFEIEQGKDEYLNNISATITRKALSKGVYIRPLGNTVYIMPPYCITAMQLQQTYTVIREVIAEIQTPSV